jgi:hypothetical protein
LGDSNVKCNAHWTSTWMPSFFFCFLRLACPGWSSPKGQNEMVPDDPTHYEYGLSTYNVQVMI